MVYSTKPVAPKAHEPRYCIHCRRPLQAVGHARKNGKRTHGDWKGRQYHKRCLKLLRLGRLQHLAWETRHSKRLRQSLNNIDPSTILLVQYALPRAPEMRCVDSVWTPFHSRLIPTTRAHAMGASRCMPRASHAGW